ncbi:DUF1990 family protein [Kribbella sp. CA-247076]|uniref:DUF1990 family protein n=1 Tax=Kribbella sp. CA-247076 TaxID=3239941 RepID=UPI003D90906F
MKLEDLEQLRFTYDAIGSTRYDETPPGYHRMEYQDRLGKGDEVFHRAGEALLNWRMHRTAGMPVTATDSPAVIGTNSLGRLGAGMVIGRLRTVSPIGQVGFPVPCRVVWTVDEPDRIGFAYGTLEGHPASGEESFVVTREPDGIHFTVRSYSRPATWYTRLGGPVTRQAQYQAARRYTKALTRLAAP